MMEEHLEDWERAEREVVKASAILPAWFCARMMADCWFFALHLTTGRVVEIECIDSVTRGADGTVWLDVTMRRDGSPGTFVAPTTRTKASINAAHVVMAYELADT